MAISQHLAANLQRLLQTFAARGKLASNKTIGSDQLQAVGHIGVLVSE